MDFNKLIIKLQKLNKKQKIVFPEGSEKSIQNVAKKLIQENIAIPVLIFKTQKDKDACICVSCKKIVIENEDLSFFAKQLYDLRKHKLDNYEQALNLVKKPNYFATMLLLNDQVDAYLGGITYTTAQSILPGLQIIKTKKGVDTISSTMILKKEEDVKYFSDIAINVNPNPQLLSQIAIQSANLVKSFNQTPEVALLSFSTKGSAKTPEVEKVIEAGKIMDTLNLDFNYDYEFQFDAAFDSQIRSKKAPNSKLKNVNTYIFPDLNSGNIGYKIAQRLGNYEAIGPIITGFNKTINDLSRGANEEEIFKMSIISAICSL